jgi:hypothetical protein
MIWWDRAKSALRLFFMETSYVARVYGDSLRDNFVGYVPTDDVKFKKLEGQFEREMDGDHPYLANLLRIEAALLETMPDNVMQARFWAIEDRFQRVVPLATRTRYEASVPPRGDLMWKNAAFMRDQQRALLDVVHANYLINIGREKSIKRLKIIILAVLTVVLIVAISIFLCNHNFRTEAFTMIGLAGIVGSMLSITQRLQTAVSRDAMTEDGIYELTGLRTGWIGVLMSFLMGGGFALVLYCIVMSGGLSVAYPEVSKSNTSPPSPHPTAPPVNPKPGATDKAAIVDSAGPSTKSRPDATVKPSVATTSATPVVPTPGEPTPASIDQASGIGQGDVPKVATGSGRCEKKKPEESSKDKLPVTESAVQCTDVERLADAIGLDNATSFFKMLILAFLAGFAERLVPDILSRLNKRIAGQ